mgnify:FL=1
MSIEIPFKRLSDADELLPFDCGDEDLNNYLFSDALSYQNQLLSVTYYLDNGHAGYHHGADGSARHYRCSCCKGRVR